jgi:lysozyme
VAEGYAIARAAADASVRTFRGGAMKKLVATLIVLVAAAGAIFGSGWLNPWLNHYVEGVDVSRHQGAIDWRALAGSGVKFAYIKASEGADFRDDRFASNWRESAATGIKRGAYHFFTLCRPGAEQAANFLRTVPRDPNALPPAIDLEHMGPCREGPQVEHVGAEVRSFLDLVQATTGVRPILYVTREFHDAYLAELNGERFWVRSLFRKPDFRQNDWIIWQHHNKARRHGVSGPVDLNAFRGDEAALERFATSGAPAS